MGIRCVLFSQALATVGDLFPHYSLHDASHSESLLERVASLLGDSALAHLSATDLWLLLEAAYLHDAGMIALLTTKRSDLESKEFDEHLKRMTNSTDEVFGQAAKRLREREPRYSPIEILEGHIDLLVIYAEFVRARHPLRAAGVALKPSDTAGVDSPRVSVLPNRFWHIIGDICRAHEEARTFVMSLPASASGAGTDVCHPRFVACMLRLGDLLDLDSDRFCPALNATIGALPLTSEAHRKKHVGIRHLLVDTNRIEVRGVYQDVDSYLAAEKWFAMLRDELKNQLVEWHNITPSKEVGPLPSVGVVEAKLEGQIVFDGDARPRFEVDAISFFRSCAAATFTRGQRTLSGRCFRTRSTPPFSDMRTKLSVPTKRGPAIRPTCGVSSKSDPSMWT
jgi:hypothetical protein